MTVWTGDRLIKLGLGREAVPAGVYEEGGDGERVSSDEAVSGHGTNFRC